MKTRKKLIVANWKMHKNVHESSMLADRLAKTLDIHMDVEVVLCPGFLALQTLSLQINRRQFKLGAQNCYWRDEGAYTGEVSASQLRDLVSYVIIGHSERRHIFGESEKDIRSKVQAVVRNKMIPILCVGETAQHRVDRETRHVLQDQVRSGLSNLTSDEVTNIVIAYEPVWAIGTGNNAAPSDVLTAAEIIYQEIEALYGRNAAGNVRILYGGSSTFDNAESLLSVKRIDGLLVGGASLNEHSFAKIIAVAHNRDKNNTDEK
ncbi:MAG: triose-phosphate isomerase [Candidatus Saccharimonadales bacterium]